MQDFEAEKRKLLTHAHVFFFFFSSLYSSIAILTVQLGPRRKREGSLNESHLIIRTHSQAVE
jgi:hypothetical protein